MDKNSAASSGDFDSFVYHSILNFFTLFFSHPNCSLNLIIIIPSKMYIFFKSMYAGSVFVFLLTRIRVAFSGLILRFCQAVYNIESLRAVMNQ